MEAVCFWEIFSGGGILGQAFVPEVRAEELPAVSGLSIFASGDGISAGCEFSGYGAGSDYVVQLYLHEIMADGSKSEMSCKDIAPTDSGTGSGQTDTQQVESGVYMATAVVNKRAGSDPAFFGYRESALYDVVKSGDSYVVTERGPASTEPNPGGAGRDPEAAPGEGACAGEFAGCRHGYLVYEPVQAADPEQDALLAGECGECGAVLSYSYVPNSAYAAFLQEAARAVREAEEAEVFITTRRWVSFNQAVLDAMAERPEVSVTVNYRYEGRPYTVTVPAGAEVSGLADENGFCGFRYLDQVFGGREAAE